MANCRRPSFRAIVRRLRPANLRPTGGLNQDIRAIIAQGRRLLARSVRNAWQQNVLSRAADGLFSSVLGAEDVGKLLEQIEAAQPAPATTPPSPVERSPVARLRALLEGIGCGPIVEEVLAVLLAVEIDPLSRSLAGYLRGNSGQHTLTIGTLVLGLGEAQAPALLVSLAQGAPARRHRLVEVNDRQGDLVAAATVRVAARLLRWLVEPGGIDDEVSEYAELMLPLDSPLGPAAQRAAEKTIQEVQLFLTRQRAQLKGTADMVLRGPRGVGRSEIALEACRRLGLPALVTRAAQMLAQPSPADAAAALLREGLLLDAQIIVIGCEDAMSEVNENAARLRMALGSSTRPLLLTTSGTESPRFGAGRTIVARDLRICSAEQREEVWAEVMPEVDAQQTASFYRIGIGAIGRVANGGRLRAQVRGAPEPTHEDVCAAVRAEFETDLGTVATRIDVSQTWDDLVVPEDTGRTIAELVDQLRHRATVLGRWGFQRKLGKGVGTTALFSGEPGTGKSMVAGLIAKELGLELHQIDLSRVLSKWIGETEKNLSKVFDAAETGHVVLLFDEADALLGKRTSDTKSANDRYANIETNYILQRLEQFHGIAILTSNLESSIDPALSRRLSFELRFPFPDEEQRAEIWRRMMPTELPIEGDLDYDLMAERFEIAGGHIRNIVLRSAYLAAAEKGPMTMSHLLKAAENEYRDHGMLVARGKLVKK